MVAPAAVVVRGRPVMAVTAEHRTVGGQSAIVVVEGELDAATGAQLRDRLRRAADGRCRVLVDLRAVSFVDVAGGRALADGCAELAAWKVDASVVPSAALERLLAVLAEVGRTLEVPLGPSVIDANAEVMAVSLTPSTPRLRPVEARVLRLLDAGFTETEVAFRFQRSVRWVEQVASVARRRAEWSVR